MMRKAIVFKKSVARWLLVRLVSPYFAGIAYSRLGCIGFREVEEPRLVDEGWVRIQPKLSGICGSDISTILCKGSPYFSPLTSTPFVMGHEVLGVVTETGSGVPKEIKAGARVVVEPALGCVVRGIEPMCRQCEEGNYANCENVARGAIQAGIQTGYCASTGGGWSQATVVAHHSQVHVVPDRLEDVPAVLAEPLACAIHSVAPVLTRPPRNILVIGCGSVGLLVIAAYRLLGGAAPIIAVAKYNHQAQLALQFGATKVIKPAGVRQFYESLLKEIYPDDWEKRIFQPEIGKPVVVGGYEVVMDCVGSDRSIDDSLRLTAANGSVALVGMPAIPKGVDWTAVWYKNLTVRGTYAYGYEKLPGSERKKTIQIALELLAKYPDRFKPIVSGIYPLERYKDALRDVFRSGKSKSIKAVLKI
ncbi:MAG: zinc-dependent alcohol dehydrogenase [Verrucomicrobiia bacterium]|jgi:threonine dehydrogenase-like Zn-dependent dehydrogenase